MALISCSNCHSDNDIHLEGMAPDGSRILRCGDCGHTWSPTVLTTLPTFTRSPFEMAKGRFANAGMVASERRTRVTRLRTRFLKEIPEPDAEVADHVARYQQRLLPRRARDLQPAGPARLRHQPPRGRPRQHGRLHARLEAPR